MGTLDALLERRRLVLASAALLALAGAGSWLTMPREEDPQFPRRHALVVTTFPGADAETVERLVVEPIEEHLAEVETVAEVFSTARAGVAVIEVELRDQVYATDKAWDDVEDALAEAREEFPAGVSEPDFEDDLVSLDAMVYAVVGSADPLVLAAAAERAKRELLAIDAVKRVNVLADPGEQVVVEYDGAAARRLGLDPRALGAQLAERSRIVPGGVIHLGPKTANLRPATEFHSLEEIRRTPIVLPSGASVPLSELARVRRGPAEPPREIMRWNGEPAVALGVVPQDGIDRVELGREMRERVAEIAPRIAPVRLAEMIFQPDLVESRLAELTGSLRLGILIVAAVLFLAMGPRLGFVVAAIVPLVACAAIALYAADGGILHQISIAALVIALGMLVDNAIVVVENVQFRLDQGTDVHLAAVRSVKELALPLGTATGTTLAAFVPMLISKGGTADFTRAIPVLIMTTLAVSYFFAVLVTPVLSEIVLKPSARKAGSRFQGLARRIGELGVRRSGWALTAAVVLVALAAFSARFVERKFFPASDRTTVIVELEMPEGTHLEATDAVALKVERALLAGGEVESAATFVGRNGPKFYYNLPLGPASPHRSMIVAETASIDAVERVIAAVREYLRAEVPEAAVVARRLEQGPPIEAPIEIRILGRDLDDMERVADRLLAELRSVPGTRDTRHDLGLGAPQVAFEIDDAAAGRHGLSRTDVALALLGRTLGTEVGQFRAGDDPVPILVRSSAGEKFPVADLATIDVAAAPGAAAPGAAGIPLAQVASLDVEWRPAAIHHKSRQRIVKVQAQLAEGATAYEVSAALEPRLRALELPPGVRLEMGGELEESGKANAEILANMPLGLLLLLFFLLLEFNSFRRVAIVLVTVPLAAVGVVPGLILSSQPFGFTAMLGVISLVGIVVNNAIVLLDLIETKRGEGMPVDQALTEAVERRTRPILLTMATTVAGLSPLAFSKATLWPPLAWAMISGLTASTVLTLVVVPALYKLLFTRPTLGQMGMSRRSLPAAGAVVLAVFAALLFAGRADAAEAASLTLEEAMERSAARPRAEAAAARARAAELRALAVRREALLPVLDAGADLVRRDRDFDFATPLGSFTLGERTSTSLGLRVSQPVFHPARRLYATPAADAAAAAAGSQAVRTRQELAAEAAASFLAVLEVDAAARSTEAFIESLAARLEEMQARVDAGRVLEADALKIRLDLESAELDRKRLADLRVLAVAELGRAAGADGPVEPDFDGEVDRDCSIAVGDAVDEALARRPDVAALESRVRSLELEARAIRAERLPRLDAELSYQRSDGDPFRPDELATGTVSVSWTPFASGTRGPRAAAAEAEAAALRADLAELRWAVRLELTEALARLDTARSAVEVRARGVELAAETLRVERERHAAGRSTTNDLLASEAALRRQRTEHHLARFEVLRSWVRYDLAAAF
jgi:multidrug efflux pump subunit AcrB/outer membrane protein TolC